MTLLKLPGDSMLRDLKTNTPLTFMEKSLKPTKLTFFKN